jgi:hypothetical protein
MEETHSSSSVSKMGFSRSDSGHSGENDEGELYVLIRIKKGK